MQVDDRVDDAQIVGYAVETAGLQDVADGTLKDLSMHYFGHDDATGASTIDPASFGQDVQ